MDPISIFVSIVSGVISNYSYDWLRGNFKKVNYNTASEIVENELKTNQINISQNDKEKLIERVKSKINFDAELRKKYNVVFEEHFSDNRCGWFTGYSKVCDSKSLIGNGFYEMENLESKIGTINSVPIKLNFENDFFIECTLRIVKGDLTHGFGICWGGSDDNLKNNQFTISGNGGFNISFRSNDHYDSYSNWINNSNILTGYNQDNILSIEKTGNRFEFYINGMFIFRTTKPLNYGNQVGLVANFDTNIIFRYLKVYGS